MNTLKQAFERFSKEGMIRQRPKPALKQTAASGVRLALRKAPVSMTEGTIRLDLTVPCAWPPNAVVKLFEGVANGSTLEISASPNATLQFKVLSAEDRMAYETPHLVLPDFAFLKVAFRWGPVKGIGCAINGQLVSDIKDGPVALEASSHPPTRFRQQVGFAIPQGCIDVELSFLRFTLDLQARIATNDPFNLREASAILRRLLLDARPIIHLVNRTYRQKLRFPFVEERHIKEPPEGPAFQFSNLCPDFADPAKFQILSLDDFLAKPVLRDRERSFTVREVVDVCANLKGGIHFGEPLSQEEASLIKLDRSYLPFFVDATFAALPGIGWTTINGTRPLLDAILTARTRNGA